MNKPIKDRKITTHFLIVFIILPALVIRGDCQEFNSLDQTYCTVFNSPNIISESIELHDNKVFNYRMIVLGDARVYASTQIFMEAYDIVDDTLKLKLDSLRFNGQKLLDPDDRKIEDYPRKSKIGLRIPSEEEQSLFKANKYRLKSKYIFKDLSRLYFEERLKFVRCKDLGDLHFSY